MIFLDVSDLIKKKGASRLFVQHIYEYLTRDRFNMVAFRASAKEKNKKKKKQKELRRTLC
jgi:hypothetical protein